MDAIILINAALGACFSVVIALLMLTAGTSDRDVPWPVFAVGALSLFLSGAIAHFQSPTWLDWPGGHLVFTLAFTSLAAIGLRKMHPEAWPALVRNPRVRAARPVPRKPVSGERPLLTALDKADPATMRHCQRVAKLAVLIARELGMNGAALDEVRTSALLHDVGKIGVRSAVLRKRQRLTEEEWREIKDHAWLGRVILSRTEGTRPVGVNVLCHHEKYDGSGYPSGLQGEEIPLVARIVAVADAFDVITHGREYQQPRDEVEAVDELLSNAGTQFDPAVVMAFLRALRSRRRKGLLALEAV